MSTAKYKTILLFGGPGSGKGTQGHILGAVPQFFHLSSGDIFRSLSAQSTIGQEFRSYSAKGLLVPDDLTVKLWLRYTAGLVNLECLVPEYHTLVSDGIPRTPVQADLLAEHLDVLAILYFDISDARLVERLQGRALKENRSDDANEDVISRRIRIYTESTMPLLEKYPQQIVRRINADQCPVNVARDVFTAVQDLGGDI